MPRDAMGPYVFTWHESEHRKNKSIGAVALSVRTDTTNNLAGIIWMYWFHTVENM